MSTTMQIHRLKNKTKYYILQSTYVVLHNCDIRFVNLQYYKLDYEFLKPYLTKYRVIMNFSCDQLLLIVFIVIIRCRIM